MLHRRKDLGAVETFTVMQISSLCEGKTESQAVQEATVIKEEGSGARVKKKQKKPRELPNQHSCNVETGLVAHLCRAMREADAPGTSSVALGPSVQLSPPKLDFPPLLTCTQFTFSRMKTTLITVVSGQISA